MSYMVRKQKNWIEVNTPWGSITLSWVPSNCGSHLHSIHIVSIDNHLINLLEGSILLIQLNNLHPFSWPTEHVAHHADPSGYAINGLEDDVGIAQEEAARDMKLNWVFCNNPGVVQVTVHDPGLCQARQLEVYPGAPEPSGFVIAVNPGEGVGLAGHHHAHCRWIYYHVGDGVIVADDVYGRAGKAPLTGVAPGGDVLTEEGAVDEGLVATLDEDSGGVEMGDVAVVYGGSERVYDCNAAAPVVGIQHEVSEADEFVVIGWWWRN